MELHHQRLVFRADRAYGDRHADLGRPCRRILRRVRADGEPGQLVFANLRRMQDDARVERDQPARALCSRLRRRCARGRGGEQRVDVDLLDPGLLDHELAETHQQARQRVEVDRRAAAHALERLVDHRLLHHAPRQRRVERGQGERAVAKHLDQLAARAEQQHRAELRVDAAADDQFIALDLDHRLHGHAEKVLAAARARFAQRLCPGFDRAPGAPHRVGIGEVQLHAAGFRLMGDGLRVQLEHDGIADRGRACHRFVFAAGDLRRHGRDAVGREDLLRFELGQQAAARLARVQDELPYLRPVRRRLRLRIHQGRGFVQAAQVVGVAIHQGEGARGRVRIAEGRYVRLVEYRLAGEDVLAAHPAGEHRLAPGGGEFRQTSGRFGRIGHRLRRERHQQAVAVRVLRGDLEHLRVAVRVGVAEDVDRVAVAPVRRQHLVEGLQCRGGKFGQFAAEGDQGVGGEHARAAGVGDYGQARTGGARLLRQDFGHVEQIGDGVDAQHAAAAEHRVEDVVAAGERAGMRGGGLGRGRGAPGLDHDDRLGQRDLARGGDEGARIADGLHVDHDAVGVRIVAEIIDQVAPVDVEHRADGDAGAEADVFAETPVEHGCEQRAALADEAHRAGARHGARKGCVQVRHGAHHAQAIRADETHPAARPLGDLPFQLDAGLARLLETGRNDDRAFHAGRDAFADHAGHRRGGGDDDGQIDSFGHAGDVGIGPDAQHLFVLLVDRIDGAAERIADQVPQHGAPDAAFFFGRADHGYALGRKNGAQRFALEMQHVQRAVGAVGGFVGGGFQLVGDGFHFVLSFCIN